MPLKSLLHRDAPFQVRLRLDPAMWDWFFRFARRCNEADMISAGHARQALLNSSRALYDELMREQVLTDCEWETRGFLFVHRHRDRFDEFGETNRLLEREFNLPAQPYGEREFLELEPALKPGVAGAWYYECDAHLRPDKLMLAWRRRLLESNVDIRETCEFMGLESGGRSVSAIHTSCGRIEVDQVVFATGTWSRLLRNQLGATIPIEPGKGYSITMNRPARCPIYPMIFAEDHVAITPTASAYRIGSTMEFAGFDQSLRPSRLRLLTNAAKRYLHEPFVEPVLETWYGWRPMSADGIPLIGRLPLFDNAWLTAGHSMLGVSMSPGTGKLLAELATKSTPHVDPAPYRVDRF